MKLSQVLQSRPWRGQLFWVALLISMWGVTVVTTTLAYPLWDDGGFAIPKESEVDFVGTHQDRPIYGALFAWQTRMGGLFASGIVIHAVLWAGLVVATVRFHRQVFPGDASFAYFTGFLVLAPLICKAQIIQLNLPWYVLPATIVTCSAATSGLGNDETSWGRFVAVMLAWGVGIVLVSLISEYTVPAVAAFGIAIVVLKGTRRSMVAAAVMLGAGAIGYLIFHSLASSTARDSVRPELMLQNGILSRVVDTSAGAFSFAWQATFGHLMSVIGEQRIVAAKSSLLAFAIASCAGCGCWLLTRVERRPRPGLKLIGLFLAIACAALPIAFMGRRITTDFTSTRYLVPMLPISICFVSTVVASLSSRRGVLVIVSLLVAFGTYTSLMTCYERYDRRVQLASWGAEIQPLLAESGMTVAVFLIDGTNQTSMRDYELTAQLTMDWDQQVRDRFWAFSDLNHATLGRLVGVDETLSISDTVRIERKSRVFSRLGAVDRLLVINASFVRGIRKIRTLKIAPDKTDLTNATNN